MTRKQQHRVAHMEKHSVFASGVILLVGVIAFQSMRAGFVPNAPQAQVVSPMELMQNARNLPADRIDYPY
jgi:hypothetical protein